MRIAKRALAAGAAAGLALGVLGAGVASAATPYPPNDNQDWIRIGGSDTTYEMMQNLSELYNNAPGCVVIAPSGGTQNLDGKCADQDLVTPGKQIGYLPDGAGNSSDPNDASGTTGANADWNVAFNYYPLGSSSGITQLTNRGSAGYQVIDVARSSRARKVSDNANLRFFAYAKDAIPWVRFGTTPGDPSFGVNDLTSAQVTNIFSGCSANATNPQIDLVGNGGNGNGIADWGDVGGVTGEPIVVWAAQAGSGTRATFDGFLGSGANSENCIPDQYKDGNAANGERVVFENNATPIVTAGNTNCSTELPGDPTCELHSIFYYSLGRWNQSGGEGSLLGNLNGIAPDETNVISGAYGYSRFVYNVVRQSFGTGDSSNAVREFVAGGGFLCKPSSQHIVNPKTGNNFRTDVENVIRADGFFPLPFGTTGLGLADSHCRAS